MRLLEGVRGGADAHALLRGWRNTPGLHNKIPA